MQLADRSVEYVRACFTGIWIESHEHTDALGGCFFASLSVAQRIPCPSPVRSSAHFWSA